MFPRSPWQRQPPAPKPSLRVEARAASISASIRRSGSAARVRRLAMAIPGAPWHQPHICAGPLAPGSVLARDAIVIKDPLILAGHLSNVLRVVFSPDGARLATASSDHTARLWNPESGDLVATLNGHRGAVTSVVFTPAGDRLVTASADRTAKIWDPDTAALARRSGCHPPDKTLDQISPCRSTCRIPPSWVKCTVSWRDCSTSRLSIRV